MRRGFGSRDAATTLNDYIHFRWNGVGHSANNNGCGLGLWV
jgi:hypothetical protein